LYNTFNEKGGKLMERSMKTIRFPGDILEQMRPLIAKKKVTFTNFVIDAIKNYIRVLNYQEGINASFGAWKDSRHPELKDGQVLVTKNARHYPDERLKRFIPDYSRK